jgi:G3E family GTPase
MSSQVLANDQSTKMEEDDEEFHEIPENEKSPVTIVTGFLGSGKTTLVNYILKEQRDKKICVVENEFGEVSIDDALVEENLSAREDIIIMDNGCVCCSIRGDLVRTFGMLCERRKEFDAIILETTGLADPAPILFTFSNNATINDNYRVDSVVCLVDAKHVSIHLDEIKPEGDVNEAEHQIAFADRIMLNKLDLVSEEELEDVIDRIRALNSFAEIIKTQNSRAPLDKILNLNSFSLEKVTELNPAMIDYDDEEEELDHNHNHVHNENCGTSCKIDHDHGAGHDHAKTHDHDTGHDHDETCGHPDHDHKEEHPHEGKDHDHGHGHKEDHPKDCKEDHDHGHGHKEDHPKDGKEDHDHGHGHKEEEHHHKEHAHVEDHKRKKPKKKHNLSLVSSVGFTIDTLLDVALFNQFMSQLLQAKAKDLYRTKGVLAFADQGDIKFVFQGVHEQINFGPSDKPWGVDEVRQSKLVFIGKNLDYDYFNENLKLCTVDPQNAKVVMHKRA